MLDILVIDNLAQLKCVSDPFRIKLLELLSEGEKTGQQLADELHIPRAKIHYHLRELEKYRIIEMVKTEQKHSIIQKFYAPTAKQLLPSPDLLKFGAEETKKELATFKLQLNQEDFNDFKKDMKKFVKKSSKKSGSASYEVTILPSTEL
ncbi:ArsR/SmtB family transcription factor [Macrococcus equipercicus]|uniref:Winged helix-turn-helix transcriptional regulator n=1 Tax=Macrococcus equipercicus TaxID=69967 RepID=A0A9Q9BN29_9STAP|nr:winged helix-turn-helix domain-containing protein [Macrococcus equipercicus]KAA1036931.1 winged helix-turn-helix transcriptional regulator [Macrococcus equipercicus]UTH14165.1 winged helix-turn-helix transcriptional regulator [Macrococcus equipercicus]